MDMDDIGEVVKESTRSAFIKPGRGSPKKKAKASAMTTTGLLQSSRLLTEPIVEMAE